MKKMYIPKSFIPALAIALTIAIASPAFAQKPSWAGGKDKGGKHEQKDKHANHRSSNDSYSQNQYSSGINVTINFGEQRREVIHNYYSEKYRSGHCPPGLAKKNNRCMPPGQARKWHVGQPLPRDVIFHDLAPELVIRLGPPPVGHRFVRVASDILMIAAGTGMIVDAIQDLSRN